MDRKFLIIISLLVVAGMLLVACGPTAEPTEPQVEPTAAPEPTEADEPEPEPTEADEPQPTEEPAPTEEPEPVGGEIYRIAILSDMTSRNIWALYDPDASTWNYAVQGDYWPSLYGYSYQRFDFVPGIAADFPSDLEEEGEFWVSTVPLREDIVWSDGTPLTANDVAWTVNTVLAFDLSGNWEAYDGNYLDSVEAVDDYTVKFYYHTRPGLARHEFGALMGPILNATFWQPRVEEAAGDMLADLADMDPESDEYTALLGEAQNLLYTLDPEGEPTVGHWLFSRWEVGAFVENVANPDYYDQGAVMEHYANGAYRQYLEGAYEFVAYGEPEGDIELSIVDGPHFQQVLFSLYSQDAAILALQNGDVDFAMNPNGWGMGLQAQLGSEPAISMVSNPSNGFRYLAFNVDRSPLDDVALRQAVNCMIDKDFLTQQLMQGQALPVYTPVPAGNVFWYNPDVTIFCDGMTAEERLNWSVERLLEAGYSWEVQPAWNPDRGGSVDWGEGLTLPDGTAFPEMGLLAPSPGYDPLRATAGVYIEQWMNQLGMPVTAELTNFNNILTAVFDTGDWDMYILGWGLSLYPDYVCDFFYTGAGFNTPNYSNPEFDAMCDEFYTSTDLEEAQELNYQLQEILATELPYIYLFTTPIVDAYRNDTIAFPFTDVLGGISQYYGFQSIVTTAQ